MALPVSDRLFRYSFASKETARDLARNLPPAGGQKLYLYERWTTFQLLRYLLAVWGDVLKSRRPEPSRLPPILPVVLYQGSRRWNFPRAFEALVESEPEPEPGQAGGEPEARHIPRFEPLFVNLQNLADDELLGGVRTVVALLFLKYLARRIDGKAARVLLDAMHREGGIMIVRRTS